MRKTALAATAILLFIASDAAAFRARPVSDLRFEGHAVPTWNRRAASDGTDFLVLSAMNYPSREGVFSQKLVGGAPAGPRKQIGYGHGIAGLAWTGSHYLAGWSRDNALWTAPLSRDGSLLGDPVPAIVSGTRVLVAAGPASALAFAYTEDKITVRPLNLNGNPTATAVTYQAPVTRNDLTVAAVGDRFAAVFSRWNGTYLMLFRADGSLVGPATLLDGPYDGSTTHYRSNAAIAATDGSGDVLVAYGAGKWDAQGELVTAVVGPDGVLKSKQVIHTMANGGPDSIYPVAVRWDGSQYLVLANIYPEPHAAAYDPALLRVGRGGALIGELSWVSREEQDDRGLDLASNGREMLMLTGFAGLPVDAATLQARTPAAKLGRTLAAQDSLVVEAGRTGYLAAWYETDEDEVTVRASRVDAAGNYLDGEGIVLATLDPLVRYRDHVIAIDGNGPHWFVVWSSGEDFSQVWGRSVSFSGVAGETATVIGPGSKADVLWRGSHYAVLRTDANLHLDILRPDGAVAETRVLMSEERTEQPNSWTWVFAADPHLVQLQDRLLAVYSKFSATCYFFPTCHESADVTGLWLDTPGAEPFAIDEDNYGVRGVAAAGDRALIVWASYQNLYGIFLPVENVGAKPAGRFRIDVNSPSAVGLAWDGNDFLLAWPNYLTYPHESILTRRITANGTVQSPVLMRLEDGEFATLPSIAGNAARPLLLGFGLHHSAYETVQRGALLFASELAEAAAPPSAPALVCVSENPDGTITVRWQQSPNSLGHAIELQLPDGTFRQIGVAAAGATTARVSRAGLRGSVVRVRAWNERGLSQPSGIAVSLPAPQATLRSGTRACAGKPVTISYSLTGSAPFTVRWSDGLVQTNLQSSATRTVTVSRDTTLSIVSVNDASCATTDTPQSIRILVDPVAKIEEQPSEVHITRGQTATLTVRADDDLTFAWFEGDPGDITRPVGKNQPTFTTPALEVTSRYWVRVSNRCGSANSDPMVVVVSGGGKGRAVRK